jgi:hemerythrin-like domain-containing protein
MMEKTQVMKSQAELKIDPYTVAHKAQRSVLFKIAVDTGKVDYTNAANLANIKTLLANINKGIRAHAAWEEKVLHPLLARKVPRATERIEDEHNKIHHDLDILMKYLDDTIALPSTYEKLGKVVQEFYLAFNKFINMYNDHIGYEEEEILPALWNLTTTQEFITAFSSAQQAAAQASPEELRAGIEMTVNAISLDDLTQMLSMVKSTAPPQILQLWLTAAERNLSPEIMAKLKARIEATSS